MDSGALLDILGNENRRRILRLLARKPCYVTEISEYLGVSPKAVIDHLRRLEEAGLVESHTDEKRRKYFHIARNLRLEVNVSRHGFGAKSAYPASRDLDLTRCHYLKIDGVDLEGTDGVASLADELAELEALERELSLAQRWVQGRLADAREELAEELAADGRGGLYAEIVASLADGATDAASVARRVDAPTDVVGRALSELRERGVVERRDGEKSGWAIRGSV